MAFGDVRVVASNTGTTTLDINNDVSVATTAVQVGDLVYAVFVQETFVNVTAATDNLGNTYTALNAGTDAGTVVARAFYSRVTVAGNLSTVSFDANISSNNWVAVVVVLEGPISSVDRNLANITSDITSPFSCPATGTLTQASEIVIAWGACDTLTPSWFATAPMTLRVVNSVTGLRGIIASKVVASTATTTPAFTSAADPTQVILGTTTFKQAPAPEIITVTKAAVTLTGKTVTAIEPVTVAKATVTLTGKTVTIRNGIIETIPVAKATATLAGQTVTVLEGGLVPVAKATVVLAGKTVTPVNTSASLFIVAVDKADLVVASKLVTLTDNLIVSKATLAIAGKAITIRGTIPVGRASVSIIGRTVTIDTSTFQDVPKYNIRGRGSRYGLWTQGNGGTIKGRGSRAFLVMR